MFRRTPPAAPLLSGTISVTSLLPVFLIGKHHNSALCHIATTLLTRISACWNNHTPYQIRDIDDRAVNKTTSPRDHRRPLQRHRRTPQSPNHNNDGPTKPGVTTRPIDQPVS